MLKYQYYSLFKYNTIYFVRCFYHLISKFHILFVILNLYNINVSGFTQFLTATCSSKNSNFLKSYYFQLMVSYMGRILLEGVSIIKRVITYGTFDLLHYGHINLLKRAKALGDYLVVAISSDEFNWEKKHKKTYFTYEQRKQLVEAIRYVDLVIPEENWDQKVSDVHKYDIDTFAIGDDWTGKFDFLKDEGVEVVYLPRTPEISTTQIKSDLNKNAEKK